MAIATNGVLAIATHIGEWRTGKSVYGVLRKGGENPGLKALEKLEISSEDRDLPWLNASVVSVGLIRG